MTIMGNRLILVFGFITLVFLLIIISNHSMYHYRHSLDDQKEIGRLLAQSVSRSIDLSMVEGQAHKIGETLRNVSSIEHFKYVNITDPQGVVKFSSDSVFLGKLSSSNVVNESLTQKKPADGFEGEGDDYLFAVAIPITNNELCMPCHDQEKDILGALNVGLDWAPVHRSLQKLLRRDVTLSLIFYVLVLVLSFLFQRLYNNAQRAHEHFQQAQSQLIKTEKMAAIGQMAAAISHDLRNPLTGIKMATYYLSTKIDKSDEEINNILKDIELEIEYASNVVTNILTYSRPSELIYSPTNINKLIEDTMRFVALQNRDARIAVLKDYDSNVPDIFVDNKQLKQVIVNVLSNSIQSMPKGGNLFLQTRVKEQEVEIIIRDTGIGIEEKNMELVFAPFFTTKAKGVGLGLSIANNIIKKHGGRTDVRSVAGEGTTFIICLPLRTIASSVRGLDHKLEV
ncbi:MAG: hypothetical protein KJ893_08805 [Candidatus Omnitrophica bacterium]|nr:hypothetical protein [Candidatus Omnitrophota bacterium]MBU4478111.1 hypothetical protein [Candidatus Omnitrophota bacterium]MCG2702934.1 ATP-binding protein [Candidatus Omnitrophota bacterium]